MLKRIMLSRIILLVLMTLALPLQPTITAAAEKNTHQDRAEGGRVVEGFQLYLTVERETILPGEIVLLKIRLKNVTRQSVFVTDRATRYDYSPNVRYQSGQEAPLTEKGKQLKDMFNRVLEIGVKFPKIEPKKSKEYTLDITELYDFKRGETYLITVSRMVGRKDNQGKLKVTSNTVRIKVV